MTVTLALPDGTRMRVRGNKKYVKIAVAFWQKRYPGTTKEPK